MAETESIDSIRRTIHLLINHGNYASARHYLGSGLKKIFTDLTLSELKCSEPRHESVLLSMMEGFVGDTIKLVGNLRFAAVFDLIIKKDNFSSLKSSVKDQMKLGQKIKTLAENGCFAVYQSKVKKVLFFWIGTFWN